MMKGRCKGKKLVEELLLKLVWQMSERGELTPQTFYIFHLHHYNDRCSVNTKLCENGKVNGTATFFTKQLSLLLI